MSEYEPQRILKEGVAPAFRKYLAWCPYCGCEFETSLRYGEEQWYPDPAGGYLKIRTLVVRCPTPNCENPAVRVKMALDKPEGVK